ncbi:MAG: hypothetical protein QGG71_05780 [Pirellulaceae bacterium]|jgi:hypothetical protein|nr:hypothetical protein [Pirellulaceae bacterium]
MKRIALSFAVLGVLAVFNAPATASDLTVFLRGVSFGRHRVAQQNHTRHHKDLGHRAYHREFDHNEAHRYPMSYRQHGRLHDSLNHEAYHDNLGHRSAHRTRAYQPSRSYYYYYYPRSGISFSFGH